MEENDEDNSRQTLPQKRLETIRTLSQTKTGMVIYLHGIPVTSPKALHT